MVRIVLAVLFVAGIAGADTFDVTDFGAVPDDGVDDQMAIKAALYALDESDVLTFTPGEYAHSDVLYLQTDDVEIDGRGAVLRALDAERSALIVQDAAGVVIRSLALVGDGFTRTRPVRTCGLVLNRTIDVTVLASVVRGFGGCGVYAEQSSAVTIRSNAVSATFADGIHLTDGSSGVVAYNDVRDTGDDGIAVVSYRRQATPTHDVVITGNTVIATPHQDVPDAPAYHGRGIAVDGGERVTIDNNYVDSTSSACLLVASSREYDAHPTRDVELTRNTLSSCNQDTEIVHGALLVTGRSGGQVSNVRVRDNAILDTVGARSHVRVTAFTAGVVLERNAIHDADTSHAPWGFYRGSGVVVGDGNTYNGQAIGD